MHFLFFDDFLKKKLTISLLMQILNININYVFKWTILFYSDNELYKKNCFAKRVVRISLFIWFINFICVDNLLLKLMQTMDFAICIRETFV